MRARIAIPIVLMLIAAALLLSGCVSMGGKQYTVKGTVTIGAAKEPYTGSIAIEAYFAQEGYHELVLHGWVDNGKFDLSYNKLEDTYRGRNPLDYNVVVLPEYQVPYAFAKHVNIQKNRDYHDLEIHLDLGGRAGFRFINETQGSVFYSSHSNGGTTNASTYLSTELLSVGQHKITIFSNEYPPKGPMSMDIEEEDIAYEEIELDSVYQGPIIVFNETEVGVDWPYLTYTLYIGAKETKIGSFITDGSYTEIMLPGYGQFYIEVTSGNEWVRWNNRWMGGDRGIRITQEVTYVDMPIGAQGPG